MLEQPQASWTARVRRVLANLVARPGVWLTVVLCVAGGWRIGYLVHYARLPFLTGPAWDSLVYLRQAQAVSAGRFGDPTLVAFSPLYGYFLSALGANENPVAPVPLQSLFGLLALLLIYLYVRNTFGPWPAVVSAFCAAGSGILPFYESKLLSETLGLLLLLLALVVLSAQATRRAFSRGAAGGALLALSVLARANLLFSVPLILAAVPLLPADTDGVKRRMVKHMRCGLGAAVGLAIVLLAHGVWTRVHTGFFVPVTMVAASAARATSADYDGSLASLGGFPEERAAGVVSPWSVVRQAKERIAARSTGRELPATGVGIDVGGWLKRIPERTLATFADIERSGFDYGYYGERSENPWLASLPFSFGWCASLALLGAGLLARRRALIAIVAQLPLVVGVLATTTVFHPSARYRLFMVVPLLALTGFGLVEGWHRTTGTRWRWAFLGLVAVVAAIFIPRTLSHGLQDPAMWQLRVAEGEIRHLPTPGPDRIDRARARIAAALSIRPVRDDTWDRIHYLEALAGPDVSLLSPEAHAQGQGRGRVQDWRGLLERTR